MPCQAGPSYSEMLSSANDAQLKRFKRAFCEMSESFKVSSVTKFNTVLKSNPFLAEVYQEHCKEDEDTWYNHYKKQYSGFTKKEITKMVRGGVLERV